MFLSLLQGGVYVVAEGRQYDQLPLHQRFGALTSLLHCQTLQTLHSRRQGARIVRKIQMYGILTYTKLNPTKI